jgi:HlyD family secretion protein
MRVCPSDVTAALYHQEFANMRIKAISAVLMLQCVFASFVRAAGSVRTEPVTRGDVTGVVAVAGVLQPVGVVEVGPQVAGTLIKWGPNVEYRSAVAAGGLLAQLDDSFLRVRLEQEEAHVRRAEAEAEKAKAAKVDVDIALAAVDEAKGSLKEAQLTLDASRITSPIKGTILDRHGEIGQAVGPNPNGLAMFAVWPAGEPMQVWAQVDEAHVADVQPDQAVQFSCIALPGKVFRGKVARVRLNASRLHEEVQYTVEIDVEKSDAAMLPYLSADVRIATAVHKNVLLVPNAALEWLPQSELLAAMRRQANPLGTDAAPKQKSPRVWVLSEKTAKPVNVQLGAGDGNKTQIVGGDLKEGDAIIVEGSMP